MHPGPESSSRGRYGTYETDDGTVVMFDEENEDAWLACEFSEPIRWRT